MSSMAVIVGKKATFIVFFYKVLMSVFQKYLGCMGAAVLMDVALTYIYRGAS